MKPMARLDLPRQIIVGTSIKRALAVERATPLSPATVARGEAVVAATHTLEIFRSYRPIQVDRVTDGVIVGFDRVLQNEARLLRSDVVPLGDAQQQTRADAQLVRERLFPQGTGFIRDSMELEWSELSALRGRALEPETAAAIDRLGLRSAADHLLAHIDIYGLIIGQHPDGPRAGEEEARARWDEAFRLFMAQVALDYEKDTATQDELIGGYEPQLEQQRAAARAARARLAHAGDEEQEEAPSSADAAPAKG